MVEKEKTFQSGSGKSGILPIGKNGAHLQGGGTTGDIRMGPTISTTTTGWTPTCRCNCPDTVPCTVLDPFSGAGTTLLVASRLGRRSIGVELNAEYIRMAEKRIQSDPAAMNLKMELIEEPA